MMNPIRYYDRLTKNNIPLHFSLSLTNNCNLRCIHCLRLTGEKKELSTAEVKNIIGQLSAEGCLYLTLTGAEPFLRKDILEIAGFAREKGFALRFLSNGTFIDKKILARLKGLNCELRISLYGNTARTHDAITGVKGSFDKTIKGFRLLESAGIPFDIAVVVIRENFFEIKTLQAELKRKKRRFRNDFVVYPGLDGSPGPLGLSISDDQLASAVRDKLIDGRDGISQTNNKSLALSGIGRLNGYISSTGKVYPSLFLRIEVGDLRKNSFHEIWHHSATLRRLRELSLKKIPCFNCLYRRECNRDLALVAGGSGGIALAEQWCRMMKARKEVERNEKKGSRR